MNYRTLTLCLAMTLIGGFAHAADATTEETTKSTASRAPAARDEFNCGSATKTISSADDFAKEWLNKRCDHKSNFSISLSAQGTSGQYGVLVCCLPK